MITFETRQLSFEDIQTKKQIRYEQILDRLDKPKTAKEIAVELYELGLIPSTERNYTAPRLTELKKMGKVVATDKKICKWTGKKVAIYRKAEGKSKTCENCEWSCNQEENDFLKCLIDSEEKGLCECCDRFKPKTGNHIPRID